MDDLDRIEKLLTTRRLDADVFERCASDLLSDRYDGLSPIPGGTDWGRDADIGGTVGGVPLRLLVTTSRTLEGVRKNMRAGIQSMRKHGVSVERIVLANPATLQLGQRQKLVESASRAGVSLDASEIFDRGFFASRLRRDHYWRKELLGLDSGPVTLSPIAPGLAESPWSFLPLAGRADDLAALAGSDDVIVTGPPGVGKSRVLSELPNAVFVDPDAPLENIAADLRWARPTTLVVDDAAQSGPLIRRLLWLRQTESDLLAFRLIAACWPPDVEALQTFIPSARVHELDLLERGPLDALVMGMGVAGVLARREILDQAEGRAGWAVALADGLIRRHDAQSLLSGKALFGQAEKYLRRAGIGPDAIDLLAVVSALGGVTDRELGKLSAELQLRPAAAATVLNAAARCGLIDMRSDRVPGSLPVRVFTVRPPMLADALVAERVFSMAVPVVDLGDLVVRWPDRICELTRAVITAAYLGAGRARPLAEDLFDRVIDLGADFDTVKFGLCLEFLRLDRGAGERVLRAGQNLLDQALAKPDRRDWELGQVATLAAHLAQRYQLGSAIDLLLRACGCCPRSAHSAATGPWRVLDDLISSFHPEIPRRPSLRQQIVVHTGRWLAEEPDDQSRVLATSAIIRAVLSLCLRSAVPDPAKTGQLSLIDAIVPAEEIDQIYREAWPVLNDMLDHGRPELAVATIDVAEEWLRIGGGHDHPFGQDHQEESIRAARDVGVALIRALADREDLTPGAQARLRSVAASHAIPVMISILHEDEVFFADAEVPGQGWLSAEQELVGEITATVRMWEGKEPDEVITRLAQIKTELRYVRRSWPNRPRIAAELLAKTVTDPQEWLQASMSAGFMPEGCIFAEQLIRNDALPPETARILLASPDSRDGALEVMLGTESPANSVMEQAAKALTVGDYRLIETLILQKRLSSAKLIILLTKLANDLRAIVAVALYTGRQREDTWTPGELKRAWLTALSHLQPARVPACPGHDIAELFKYLAAHNPETLVQIISHSLTDAPRGAAYRVLPHKSWDVLHLLPRKYKLQLARRFQNDPDKRWMLYSSLVGLDTEWLEELVDTEEITPHEALGLYNGIEPRPPVAALAKLLVPRGVSPDRIAAIEQYGNWSGSLSAHYQKLVDSYQLLSQDSDASVRAVAEAGIHLFSIERDKTIREERTERIRGIR